MAKKLDRWSFSTLKVYERCPYRVFLQKIERAPEPDPDPDSPLVRGERIHLEAERFVTGEPGSTITHSLRRVADKLNELRALYDEGKVLVEEKWGFTQDWKSVGWDDPSCWLMVRCDAVVMNDDMSARIIDYKTGKSFGNEVPHQQQMQLYAIAAFMRFPKLKYAQAELWYLDEGKERKKVYDRVLVAKYLPRWEERARKMTSSIVFPPKPNRGNCRFCPYGQTNGTGVCAYAASE